MRTSLLLSSLAAACSTVHAATDSLFYVGFDLKPTYGTSAVIHANGTVTSVADVEGDKTYKETMRK